MAAASEGSSVLASRLLSEPAGKRLSSSPLPGSSAIILGGTGFIGRHLAARLRDHCDEVLVADLEPPAVELPSRVRYAPCDVRQPIRLDVRGTTLVFNLAAVHRTPGHPDHEYFETNVAGARNVVEFAEHSRCTRLWFTSSIAVYGASEEAKTERSRPAPTSAYGKSKLEAEQIHEAWARAAPGRRLVSVRPGTVFGPGEGGNFTRLASALRRRTFVYPGRRDTLKACGYVDDLIASLLFMEQFADPAITYNFGYPEPPTIEQVCEAFCTAADYPRPRLTLPLPIIRSAAWLLSALGRADLHPDRVMKVARSTNIVPEGLVASEFPYGTTLNSAIRDWYQRPPSGRFV